MQTQNTCSSSGYCYDDRERNEELIGVLTAISIVSKRLAGKLTTLELQRVKKSGGGRKVYGKNVRT